MSGVEIVSSEQVVVSTAFNWIWFLIVAVVIVSLFVYCGYKYGNKLMIHMYVLMGLITGLFFGFIFGIIGQKPMEYRTICEVIVSDEVIMNDFYKKYEVISHSGKIFTVWER